MRVVIDTSTLVSAVIQPRSIPHRVWLRAQGACEILASRETFSEIETVLCRAKLSRYIDSLARDQFLAKYRVSVEWVVPTEEHLAAAHLACRDPKDSIFLALAHAGTADLLISSDNDLLTLHPWRGIPILTPAQFLDQS